jgi:hypothetical protein
MMPANTLGRGRSIELSKVVLHTRGVSRLPVHVRGCGGSGGRLLAALLSAVLRTHWRMHCWRLELCASLLCCVTAARHRAVLLQILLSGRCGCAASSQLLCKAVLGGLRSSCICQLLHVHLPLRQIGRIQLLLLLLLLLQVLLLLLLLLVQDLQLRLLQRLTARLTLVSAVGAHDRWVRKLGAAGWAGRQATKAIHTVCRSVRFLSCSIGGRTSRDGPKQGFPCSHVAGQQQL